MASQSLYRKYRPQVFGELKGQPHINSALRNALVEDRIGHAYLFSGPRGTGKTTTARILAKTLNCLDLGADGEPCAKCMNCEAVAAGNFADLIELDAASNNKVENVRDLVGAVHGGLSAHGKRKVYLVDEVHMLTTAAANALLKTLEEPPDHVVFILATTDANKVLPTIRSRTQHFEFQLLSNDELREHLQQVAGWEGIDIAPEALEVVVRQGAGSARDALSKLDIAIAVGTEADGGLLDTARVLDALGGTGFERRMTVLQAIADDDAAGALLGVTDALMSGTEPRPFAEELLSTTRDAFVQSAGGGKIPFDGPHEELQRLLAFGKLAGLGRCTRVIETLGGAIADMRGQGAPDPRLILEVAVVRLARRESSGGADTEGLAERVAQLEAKLRQLAGGGDVPSGSTVGLAMPPRSAATPQPVAAVVAPDSATAAGVSAEPTTAARRPSVGSFKREPTAPPKSASVARAPISEAAPAEPEGLARSTPIEFDDIVIAWNNTLSGLNRATQSMVQQAQPIAFVGDTVTFGIAHDQFISVRARFKSNADEIREELARHLGARVRFKLEEHDFDAPGALRADGDNASAVLAAAAAELPDLVDLDELVDAPDEPARDTQFLLMSELGAHVVEERSSDT